MRFAISCSAVVFLLAASAHAAAPDEVQYKRRAAERDMALFAALDRDHDAVLTREEAQGDLDLGPRFDDADINRDGLLTRAELERYVARRYGVQAAAAR